jgi:predicted TIM-barrel fold metal-dependent hydrolase
MTPLDVQAAAQRSRRLDPLSYDALGLEAKAVVDRWVAELDRVPAETATVFRFLLAMAAVRLGTVRELRRLVRDGRPVVILVDPHSENFYPVDDPQLGDAEPAAVDAMLRVLREG